ncbi:MAG: AAA domain-containing protein [Flammeovirgaceae bacterium]
MTGIIGMLIQIDPKNKIHLCAPSNGAVDQILMRMVKKGLNGSTRPLEDVVLRVGAVSYESPKELKELELRYKV